MPRARGELTAGQRANLERTKRQLESAQRNYRHSVIRALTEGASFAEVSRETGLSTNTLQRWKREAS